jgi:hypothetical protein
MKIDLLLIQEMENNIHNYSYQNTQNKPGDNREIKGKTVSLYEYVAGQLA